MIIQINFSISLFVVLILLADVIKAILSTFSKIKLNKHKFSALLSLCIISMI